MMKIFSPEEFVNYPDQIEYHELTAVYAAEMANELLEEKLPKHKAGLYISHNEHKTVHQNAGEYINNNLLQHDFENEEEMKKAILEDNIWRVTWYPDTAVGFVSVMASTLEGCLSQIPKNHS